MARILILEKDAEIATLMKLVLEREGYQLTYNNNDQDTMSLLRNTAFDLLIMCIIGSEGWEFYNWVKAEPVLRNLRVIVLSHKNMLAEENAEWSSIVPANGDVILIKPARKEKLIETVNNMLGGADTARPVGVS